MYLVKQETTIQISNKYANTSYLFDFENANIDQTNELRFELTIDPNAFVSAFEANIDNISYIGQIKQNKTETIMMTCSKNNDDYNEENIFISQNYKDISNVFEIKANVKNKQKISLKLSIQQYLQKRLNFYSLTVYILKNFEKYNIESKLERLPFKVIITDTNNIHDVKINTDDIKTNDEKTKSCEIAGQIKKDSLSNEFTVKYKTDSKYKSDNSCILYDDNTKTFCHILNTANIIKYVNENGNILIPRRVMFVIDRSGSMEGIKWNKTLQCVIGSIQSLRKNIDRFGVIVFNSNIKLIHECNLMSQSICDYVIKALRTTRVHGQTNINKTLLKAIEMIQSDVKKSKNDLFMNQIIFITDDDSNVGETNTEKILMNVAKANKYNNKQKIAIFTFGIGSDENDSEWVTDLNHAFLNILAVNNNGFYERIKQSKADVMLTECFNILSKPILLNVNIEYKNDNIYNKNLFTRTQYPAFYNGSELVICGKLENKLNMANDNTLGVTLYGRTGISNGDNCVETIDVSTEMKVEVHEVDCNMDNIWVYFKLQQLVRDSYMNNTLSEKYSNVKPEIKQDDEMFPASSVFECKLITPWTSMHIKKSKLDDKKPNINRIVTALNNSALKDKYTNADNDMDLAVMFQEFVDEQDYSDSDMEHEFGDGGEDDCSFDDWLKEKKGIADTSIDGIWTDLNLALKGVYEESNIRPDRLKTEYDRMNYNIVINDDKLKWIEEELEKQCCDLRTPGQSGTSSVSGRDRGRKLGNNEQQQRALDRATYSILQIGKQNHNKPILMWLVDSFNRFRIQRRKRFRQKYPDKLVYDNKFNDIKISRFITDKCKGFSKWLYEYPDVQQSHFKDMCDASVKVFCHRLLPPPPMQLKTGAYIIDDNIVQIGLYILQCYNFIETFALQQNAPLPAQIDIVFIVKNFDRIPWDDDDDDDDDEKQEGRIIIGNIEERLKSQKKKINPQEIEWGMANRTLLQCVNKLIANQHNQRVVAIIDRRKDDINDKSKDKLYMYQPNKDMKCHQFEADVSRFLYEGLIQNSRICILPKAYTEKIDVGINHFVNPQCLTLSFHCFALNQIGVYLYQNGWGTRFFIEDIKYFLPSFFVEKQSKLLRDTVLEQDLNNAFVNTYQKAIAKQKCKDVKFERFFQALIEGKPAH